MKAAIVTQSNWGYRWGLNGIINGLDYHENKEIDVHYIYTPEFPQEYIDECQNTFPFKVVPIPLSVYTEKYPPPTEHKCVRWELEFYKYKLASDLAEEYDSIMLLDCDYMVLANLENWFAMVVGTDVLTTSNNWDSIGAHANEATVETWTKHWEHNPGGWFPVLNHPCIGDPKRQKDFYEAIWDMACEDPRYEDVVPFTGALIKTHRLEKLITLPGMFWMTPEVGRVDICKAMLEGKRCYLASNDKMMTAHRHWWVRPEMTRSGADIPGPRGEMIRKNVELMLQECKEINTNWKLKVDWPFDW